MKKRSFLQKVVLMIAMICAMCFAFALTACNGSSKDKASLTLDKETLTIEEWATGEIIATLENSDSAIIWSSSDETVATVDDGTVYGLKAGTATITATADDLSKSCEVTVTASSATLSLTVEADGLSDGRIALLDTDTKALSAKVKIGDKELSNATVTWTVADPTVASVTADGYSATLAGLKQGNTDVTVAAEINGKSAETTIRVAVTTKGVVFTVADYTETDDGYSTTINAIELEAGDGTTETQPTVTATYRNNPLEVTLSWAIESGDDVVTVDATTGKISALKAGTAIVVGTYHFDVLDKDYRIAITVEVAAKQETVADAYSVSVNKTTGAPSFELLAGETATELLIDGSEISDAYTLSDGIVQMNNAAFKVEDMTKEFSCKLLTSKREISFTVNACYEVAGDADWKEIWNTKTCNDLFNTKAVIKLTGNVNINKAWYQDNKNIANTFEFNGIFDGQGYTINGSPAGWNGLFYSLGSEGVIKNVAFTNIDFLANVSIFGNKLNGTLENCYFEGQTSRTDNNQQWAPIAGDINSVDGVELVPLTAKIKNVVINIHDRNGDFSGVNAVVSRRIAEGSDISGLYVINDSSNGHIALKYDENDEPISGEYVDSYDGIHVYSSAKAFKDDVTALPTGFDSNTWELKDGYLTFKTGSQYYGSFAKAEFAITNLSQVTKTEGVTLSATYNGATVDATWTFEGLESDDYTFENGVLTIKNTCTQTSFTLKAVYNEKVIGYEYVKTIADIEIKKYVQTKDLTHTALVGLNRTDEKQTLTLDDSDAIVAVLIGGETVDASKYALAGTTLSLNNNAFVAAGSIPVQIETEDTVYKVTMEVVDYAIATLAEWKAIWNSTNAPTVFASSAIIKLEANIDNNLTEYQGWNGINLQNKVFNGTLDGQGHTVAGLTSSWDSMFGELGETGVIKNISFTNIKFRNGGNTLFQNKMLGTLENVYFEGTTGTTASNFTLANQLGPNAKVSNVVIVVHKGGATTTNSQVFTQTNGWGKMTTAPSGVYVICETSCGDIISGNGTYPGDQMSGYTDLSGIHLYASVAEFAAANANKPADMSQEAWDYIQALTETAA